MTKAAHPPPVTVHTTTPKKSALGPPEHEVVAEITITDACSPTAAGAAVEAQAVHLGLVPVRAAQLRVLVERLISESRTREAVEGGTDAEVHVRHGPGHLRVDVMDRRLPLTSAESRHSQARRLIALGFADRLRIGRNGEQGNRAEIEVMLDDDDSVADFLETDETTPEATDRRRPPRASEEQAAALRIREMRTSDAQGLTRCIYRCYGYSYLNPLLYRPRQITRALRSGTMASVVAVSAEGEVVGHMALTFDHAGDPVPEAGKLVVDPRYRGYHIADRLAEHRKALALDMGLPGYWLECVTNHPYSQKEALGSGGFETGLLLAMTPADSEMTGLDNFTAGRHALVACYVPLPELPPSPGETERSRTVHVPPRHEELLRSLVESIGLDREVACVDSAEVPMPPILTELTTDVTPAAGRAHMRVAVVGDDIVERVADELEGLMAFEVAATHIDLPLWQPSTSAAVEMLEELGFFWGAYVPCFLPGGDVIRLQRLGDHPVQTDGIVCARPEGEAMRDLVLSEWRRVLRHH